MRIDLQGVLVRGAAAEAVQSGIGTASRSATAPTPGAAEDTTTLSQPSQTVPSLAEQALQAAEVRLAKVSALEQAVSSGAYTLDPGLIAEALLNSGL